MPKRTRGGKKAATAAETEAAISAGAPAGPSDATTAGESECVCPDGDPDWPLWKDNEEVFDSTRRACPATVHQCVCRALANMTSPAYREAHPCTAPGPHDCMCLWVGPARCGTKEHMCICGDDLDEDKEGPCRATAHDCPCHWEAASTGRPLSARHACMRARIIHRPHNPAGGSSVV